MGAKQKGGAKPKNTAEEVEETLQAVVLADTFETRFEPFTRDKPRVCASCVLSPAHICRHNASRKIELTSTCNQNSVYSLSPIPLLSNTPSSSLPTRAWKRSSSTQVLIQIN